MHAVHTQSFSGEIKIIYPDTHVFLNLFLIFNTQDFVFGFYFWRLYFINFFLNTLNPFIDLYILVINPMCYKQGEFKL